MRKFTFNHMSKISLVPKQKFEKNAFLTAAHLMCMENLQTLFAKNEILKELWEYFIYAMIHFEKVFLCA